MLEEDIKQLLALKTETKNLDYKKGINWGTISKEEKLDIIKDILAMANTQDGGRIVFGVRDDDYEHVEISEEDYQSFDQTKVNDLLHNYTEPKHSCQVYKHKIDNKYIVVIDTPEFEEVPIICKTDFHSSDDPNKQILKKGQIYIRTDKATSEVISSSDQIRELLGRALTKKGDELLHSIDRLIKGKSLKPTEESREKYGEEIKEAEAFLSQNIGEELRNRGYFEIYVYPTSYLPNRIPDQTKIRELIRKAQVDLTGWPFPHTHPSNVSNFVYGTQSFTIFDIYREGYRAYKSGLFIWKKAFWEDVDERRSDDGKRVLSYPYLIYLITEIFLFLKRYFEQIAPESDLHFKIVLKGTKDRKPISFDRMHDFFFTLNTSNEDTIPLEDDIKVVELTASYKDIAKRVVRQILLVFNWDITEEFIDQLQTKLIEGKA